MARLVHFGSFDDRFCGTTEQCRRFTTEPDDVTCPCCLGKDTFVLSPSGQAYLASLDAKQEPRS